MAVHTIKLLVTLIYLNVVFTRDIRLNINDKCFNKLANKNGVCILLKNCQQAIKTLKEGHLPQTCEFQQMSTSAVPIVCCPEETNEIDIRMSTKKCDEYSTKLVDLISDLDQKIVGGRNASKGEFPHMAALGYGTMDNINWSCGGTLISEYFVLTAGHCLSHQEFGNVKFVQLGHNILYRKENLDEYSIYNVQERFKHNDYKPPSNYNDIALIKLDKKVEFSHLIKPACIYTEKSFDSIKSLILATGWGLNDNGGVQIDILQQVKLELFDQGTCEKNYANIPARKLSSGIIETQFCAGSRTENSDTCQGDSGGPLQYYSHKKFLHIIFGITSFGKSCGNANSPGVYTRVSAYVPWIESVVWSHQNNV